jgi:ATP-dependent 26S proteasome regulatory subunit
MKKLIIYIPSYNRADSLMSQLKVINEEMTSDIKVVISDNKIQPLEKAFFRPVKQDSKCKTSNPIFQKYFLILVFKLIFIPFLLC